MSTRREMRKIYVNRHSLFIRVSHWIHALSAIALLATGFSIHSPGWLAINLGMESVRKIHFISAAVNSYTILVRIYYALYTKDYTDHLVGREDLKKFPGLLLYYLFIRKNHPYYGKYNPGAKMTHIFWFLLSTALIATGFLLLYPSFSIFERIISIIGGLNRIRTIHFYLASIYLPVLLLHIYLSFTESWNNLKAMFTGRVERKVLVAIKREDCNTE